MRSVDSRKSAVEPKKRKPLTPAAQLQMHKLEFEEFLKEFELPTKILCPFCNREYGKTDLEPWSEYFFWYNKINIFLGQAVAEEHISQCDFC